MIDCFFIGHNGINISKQLQITAAAYGRNSYYFRDALSARYIKYNGKRYTQYQIYNLFYNNNDALSATFDHATFQHNFNSAIAILGSYVHKKGLSIDYVHSFNMDKQELAKKLEKNNIRVIAIPTTFYLSLYPILEIVYFIRKYNKTAKIIIGGPYVLNQVKGQSPANLQKIFQAIGADVYICSNEGEYALSEVVRAFHDNTELYEINNIFFRQEDNTYGHNTLTLEENSSEDKHINWSLFTGGLTQYASIRTAVSCPFSCAFCGLPITGGKYRQLSVAEIEDQLDTLAKSNKVSGLFFIDETFNYPPERFKEILRMMIKNNYNFKWESEFRCQFADREMIEMMKESGCVQVFCGIESGSQQILNNMNKKAIVEEYKKGLGLLHEYDILTNALIIIGFPGETYETYKETYNFLQETKPTFFRTHRWYYDHETPIYDKRKEYNITGNGYEWAHSTMDADTAHNLTDELTMSVNSSIHIADYPISFFLYEQGFSVEKIKHFMETFNKCVNERIKNPDCEEVSQERVEELKYALR
ncbi:radical SAM protein [Pelosinus fermentans]|uniref:Radical SAM domain protein n=1 Tax=Pelosinus fermentans JBW45 TaxID=1192197 RepID=I8TYT6_9FIRM|nr:radical SAM protein [Pelosinus fermentans]AJQ26619.1 Radical SAM domain protein [Pelosinus fermentans JBW45]